MVNLALAGFAFGAALAVAWPTPCEPGRVVCPALPDYDEDFGRELASEMAALPDGMEAIRQEHADHMRLVLTLARLCGTT